MMTDEIASPSRDVSGESKNRYSAKASSDVLYRMSADWKEMRFLAGHASPDDDAQSNETWLQKYIPLEQHPVVTEAISRVIESKSIFELEHQVKRVDGTIGWTFSRAVPVLNSSGEITEWFGTASDISARIQADLVSAQQKRVYEAILTNTPDLAYVFDLNHRFIYANEGLLRMWGKTREEAIGKNCLELGYEPWHAALHDREIEEVVATKAPVRGEVPFSGTFGRRFYDYIFVPVLGENGEVEAVAGTTRDVTERKNVEESLARLAAIINSSEDAIISKNLEGIITSWNTAAERMFGYLAEEVLGKSILLLFPTELMNEEKEIIQKIAQGETMQHYQTVRIRKDGRRLNLSLSISPIKDSSGNVIGASKIARDITEQIEQQAALKLSEERLRAVVEASPECVNIVAPDGTLEFINQAGLRMAEIDGDEVPKGISVLPLIGPDHQSKWLESHQRVCAGERLHWEFELHGRNGTRRWVESHAVPMPLPDGRLAQLAVTRDIDHRKKYDEEREALLQSERAARSEAERANVLKDEFLATLSHELRTPLTAILGWSQALANRRDAATLQQGLEAIERNARMQTQLIEDLLDMSRIISGKVRLDVQLTDLVAVINAAIDSVRLSAEAKSIRLRTIIDPHAGPVAGDPTRLQQIVWNLLTNAIKFTPKGGSIDLFLERVDSHLEITVRDSGIGIKPELLPVIFERFRQADSSTTRAYGGLGLGLSIVKNLVELHGGSIRAKSLGDGQGATFIVDLPLAPFKSGELRTHPKTSQPMDYGSASVNLDGVKILLLDDEVDTRTLLTRLLSDCKADVHALPNAAEALEYLKHHQPDLIISDIGMPGMDGYQFMQQMREFESTKGTSTPAIALTAFARSEDRTRAMFAGYNMHVAKPIESNELLATVANLVGRRGQRRS